MFLSNAQASGDAYPPSCQRETGHISSHSHDHGARLRLPSFGSTNHCGNVTSIGRPHIPQGSPDAARLRTYCKTARRALPFFHRAPAVIRPPGTKKEPRPFGFGSSRILHSLPLTHRTGAITNYLVPFRPALSHVTLLMPRTVDLNPFESMKSNAISSFR